MNPGILKKLVLSITATAALSSVGCSSSSNGGNITLTSNGDGGITVVVSPPDASIPGFDASFLHCPANAKQCVNDSVAQICPADGSEWATYTCPSGQKCSSGDCVTDPNAPCVAAQNSCMDATTALTCNANGRGFAVTACPTGTNCIQGGVCAGAYPVGYGQCEGNTTLTQSADGVTLTSTTCATGTFCVSTGENTAACLAGDCNPNTFCTVCGNKTDSSVDQTKYVTNCVETAAGYKYAATQCSAPATCDPQAQGLCQAGGFVGACTETCTPGATRCSEDGLGVETCDATGNWAAQVNCQAATDGGAARVCSQGGTGAICADLACAYAQQNGDTGVCDPSGGIRLCGADGTVATTATACATGVCVVDNNVNGSPVGSCQAQCTSGNEQCFGGNSYQVCGTNGLWEDPVLCTSTNDAGPPSCHTYALPSGLNAHLCNSVCSPGSHQCVNFGDAGDDTGIELCDSTGHWGAPQACAVGTCTQNGNDVGCVAQCVPNSLSCAGNSATGVGQFPGTTGTAACSATGVLSTTVTACTGDTVCRVDRTGATAGCVECLGPNHGGNQLGVADTRCTDTNGVAAPSTTNSGAATETCQANDTWPATTTACANGTSCSTGNVTNYYCEYGNSQLIGYGYSDGCGTFGWGPITNCGGVSDCCSAVCYSEGTTQPKVGICE